MQDILATMAHFIWPWDQTFESFDILDYLLRFRVMI